MNFDSIDIHGLIPQKEPFVFISRILSFQETDIETEYTVKETCPLAENGVLCREGLLEIMAQSNAARIGYIAKYILNIPVEIGFIGDISGFKASRSPLVGETLKTRVNLLGEIGGLAKIYAEITDKDGEVIASATMKTALKHEKDDEGL